MQSRHFNLKLFLKIMVVVVVLGSLWIIRVRQSQSRWKTSYILTDGGEGSDVNCSEVMLGNADVLSKAKLRVLRKDFLQKVRVPDDFYIDATQDCKCVT